MKLTSYDKKQRRRQWIRSLWNNVGSMGLSQLLNWLDKSAINYGEHYIKIYQWLI